MRELLIATRNEGKVPAIKEALKDTPFTCITLNDTEVSRDFEVEENGSTYEAHAVMKAILYGKRAGVLTLADDAGLEIDALNGWPGVHTAVWMEGTREERIQGLLEKMKDIPEGTRGAQYRSVIALYDPETDKVRFAEGVCRGRITFAPEGNEGFGYDPIFFSDDLQRTFGSSSLEDRVSVSHRGRALKKMREILLAEFV